MGEGLVVEDEKAKEQQNESQFIEMASATKDSSNGGSEERRSLQNEYKGQTIAVFTSGGDSQGMNAAVRAVVRCGLYLGCEVYFIREGYQGMVDGGEHIQQADWKSVSGIIHVGGTMIGSARCKDFREREGRLKAAKNLLDRGITNLVVIGGDGSLTGANLFKNEWTDLLEELVEQGRIDKVTADKHKRLNIIGMVGSIDNDFCGTDMTIGTDSALHRIVEAVDAIVPTANSHQRTFIMEVMGRHCGYLALVAGIVTEADYVFIPESPPPINWKEKLCNKLLAGRDMGQRLNIIIVAEGAIDRNGDAITCQQIKDVVVSTLQQDTRITVLGHVQRGGAPSAFDRILGCRMGAEAVLSLMEATKTPMEEELDAYVVSIKGNCAVKIPLMQNVELTQNVAHAMHEKRWEDAVALRGRSFQRNLDTYRMLARHRDHRDPKSATPTFNMGVMHIGAPCCGMNASVRAFVRSCLQDGNRPFGIQSGIEGLATGKIDEMKWSDVNGWVVKGGALLGTKRTLPEGKYDAIAANIKEFNLQFLLVVGGFEAFNAILQLAEMRDKYPEFNIPMAVIPATISNNVPGTEFSLGADTALNEITEICDRIRQSAQGTKKRVFIIETMGGYCGYLATMAGLAGGCDNAYIHEEKFKMPDLLRDMDRMKLKMTEGKIERGLILRNEKANDNYTTDFLYSLYAEEGKDHFSARKNVLGHMQQGGTPSPFDRNLATKLALRAVKWLREAMHSSIKDGKVFSSTKESACLLGMVSRNYTFQPVQDLQHETDFTYRRWKKCWWLRTQRPIMHMLAQHQSAYIPGECVITEKKDERLLKSAKTAGIRRSSRRRKKHGTRKENGSVHRSSASSL